MRISGDISGILQYPGELLDTTPILTSRREYSYGKKDSGVCIQAYQYSPPFISDLPAFSTVILPR
jgi:hypothetical protein